MLPPGLICFYLPYINANTVVIVQCDGWWSCDHGTSCDLRNNRHRELARARPCGRAPGQLSASHHKYIKRGAEYIRHCTNVESYHEYWIR